VKRAKRQLLIHVSRLLDQCSGCKNNVRISDDNYDRLCGGCPVYEELKIIRPNIDEEPTNNYEHLLSRGLPRRPLIRFKRKKTGTG